MSYNMIELQGVCFSYKIQNKLEDVFSNIGIQIKNGEFIAILGKNGSGKSTLARLLNALLIPTSGEVIVNGMKTKDQTKIWQIRKTVGMIFQNPDNQIVGTSLEEDVAFGPENTGVFPSEINFLVDECLEIVGLKELRHKSPNLLSGGEKQKLAIASILAMKPECIVMDEATSMLDPQSRNEIIKLIKELNRSKGITVVCITHFMEEALNFDRILVMDEGKIKLEGTPEDIFSSSTNIEDYGLKLPPVIQLLEEIKKEGYNIPTAVLDSEQATEVLIDFISKETCNLEHD